jgi:RimJ/RimL family protein N-acetyltransferase
MIILAPQDLEVLGHDDMTGISILFERGSLLSLQLLSADDERFKDILVPALALNDIQRAGGWFMSRTHQAFSVVALDEQERPVATAEAAPIYLAGSEEMGLNLSYAVAGDWEGRGLAKLCAAYALLGIANTVKPAFVLVQIRAGNEASGAVAQRLGMARATEQDYFAPVRGEGVAFQAFRGEFDACCREAMGYLADRAQERQAGTTENP